MRAGGKKEKKTSLPTSVSDFCLKQTAPCLSQPNLPVPYAVVPPVPSARAEATVHQEDRPYGHGVLASLLEDTAGKGTAHSYHALDSGDLLIEFEMSPDVLWRSRFTLRMFPFFYVVEVYSRYT